MEQEEQVTRYRYTDLSYEAQQRVKADNYNMENDGHAWWTFMFDEFYNKLSRVGIEIDTQPVLMMNGHYRKEPAISFNSEYMRWNVWFQADIKNPLATARHIVAEKEYHFGESVIELAKAFSDNNAALIKMMETVDLSPAVYIKDSAPYGDAVSSDDGMMYATSDLSDDIEYALGEKLEERIDFLRLTAEPQVEQWRQSVIKSVSRIDQHSFEYVAGIMNNWAARYEEIVGHIEQVAARDGDMYSALAANLTRRWEESVMSIIEALAAELKDDLRREDEYFASDEYAIERASQLDLWFDEDGNEIDEDGE